MVFSKGLGQPFAAECLEPVWNAQLPLTFFAELSLKLKKQAINRHSGSGCFFSVDSSELVLELSGKARHLLDILVTSSLSPKSCIA